MNQGCKFKQFLKLIVTLQWQFNTRAANCVLSHILMHIHPQLTQQSKYEELTLQFLLLSFGLSMPLAGATPNTHTIVCFFLILSEVKDKGSDRVYISVYSWMDLIKCSLMSYRSPKRHCAPLWTHNSPISCRHILSLWTTTSITGRKGSGHCRGRPSGEHLQQQTTNWLRGRCWQAVLLRRKRGRVTSSLGHTVSAGRPMMPHSLFVTVSSRSLL